MAAPVLKAQHLSIQFGGLKAVDDFNMEIGESELVGLIGPNGAGKTTVFNLITGVYKPTEGSFYLCGERMDGKKTYQIVHAGIARTFQNVRLFNEMSVLENVMVGRHVRTRNGLWAALSRHKRAREEEKQTRELAWHWLDYTGIAQFAHYRACDLAYGHQRRLEIARALATNMKLLLLDEPINGLDPQGIAEIRDMIFKLRDEQNMTIIISSHILEELSKIATHYGIIHNGTLVQEITKEELMQRCGERMEIFLDDPKQALPVLDQMGFKNYQVTDKNTIHIYERLDESAAVNMELAKAGVSVRGIGITSEELENYFLNLTGGACNA